MLARAHAHCLLAALSAVALLAVASAQPDVTLDWELISYPTGDDQHKIVTSPSVTVAGNKALIKFETLYRSGDTYGSNKAGLIVQQDGTAAKEYDASGGKGTVDLVSNNPDFSSILQVDGKIFGVTHFEAPRPGVAYVAEYEQDATTGKLTTKRLKPVDFSSQDGCWVPCAGSVTPWQTHIGSEEYPPDAKAFFAETGETSSSGHRDFQRWYGQYNNSYLTYTQMTSNGYHPYAYGYPWETVVKADFTETTTKLYAHGRQSYEMSYVMPDEKTVYSTDDGTNCIFSKFVSTTAKDIKNGKNWCMKMTQTSAVDSAADDFTADVTWIEMPTPTHDEAKAARKTTTFADLFDHEDCNDDGTCPTTGFQSINIGSCECLKLKSGKDKLATVFEKRRMAAYLGCTTEFRKWEGFTYDHRTKKAYTAISAVERGMLNGDARDKGGPNHIKVEANKCGCVMEFDIDSSMSATKARMLTCGRLSTMADATTKVGRFDDECDTDEIANPDNVAMIPEAKQLMIGEDTSNHIVNLVWIWDFKTSTKKRVAAVPMGSETTSPYWYKVGDWYYMTLVAQHPYGAGTLGTSRAEYDTHLGNPVATGKAAWIGYVGPIPVPNNTTATTTLESAGIRTASASAFLTLGAMSAVAAFSAV
jgi:secreted PhoX family phosphatase